MSRTMVLTLVIALLLIGASATGMALVLRQRLRGARELPERNLAPEELGEPVMEIEGEYVSTTRSGDHLDRVHSYGLGMKSASSICVHPHGLRLLRGFAPDLFIPAADLLSFERTSGQIGKFVEREGLIGLGWRLEGEPVTTAFRTRYSEDAPQLLAAMAELYPSLETPGTPAETRP